ncbi:Vacuolar membrane protease [Candida viswanathii]|uniref:Peptide hydrolase n=1 Tax=Candida viswanathii TaxID=5486 RepID=A0A367XPM7_9ASCO|nr:Vacuolar membrane protease [Candida viswanathii]
MPLEGEEGVHEQPSAAEPAATEGTTSVVSTKEKQPNVFVRAIRATFGYRKTSLTLFVLLTIIFTVAFSSYDNSLDFTIDLPETKYEKELLDASWLDLQNIAQYPHSYGSHANDKVHDYLKTRIGQTIKGKSYIEYADGDERILYNSSKGVVSYYESNNLLVRVNGTDSSLPAFLLSAHFDSVPSSYGVTDDGMGIASLLGVLSFLATSKQPKRTVIFNFNNNEEFGLYGAQAFVSHPWFKQIEYFLNLEGTGAGGKAILFRGTDYGIVKHFDKVRFPYATSIFQQGFNNRLIHSETDYKVYKEAGLRGLDLAFYKPRDIYHTGEDNIRNINIKSLWHMLSNSIDFTKFIASQKIDDKVGKDEPAAYTSILNYFFSTSVTTLSTINMVLIVLFPVISGPLLFISVRYKKWNISTANFFSLPLAILLTSLIGAVVVNQGFRYANEFLPTSRPMLLVATTTSILLLIYYVLLNGVNFISPSGDQKLISIIEISFIYWIALIFVTKGLSQNAIGDDHTGEFPFTILFLLEATASLFGLIGWTFTRSVKEPTGDEEPLLNGHIERYVDDSSEEDETRNYQEQDDDEEDDHHHHELTVKHLMQHFGYDWSLQFLLIVPISSLVIYNSGWLVIDGINKSIQESLVAENLIYLLIQLFAQFWILPILPFVYKLNRFIVLGLTAFAIVGVTVISFAQPFNHDNPLKLRFIEKDGVAHISGRTRVGIADIIGDMPSVKESGVKVRCESLADGNEDCFYKALLPGNSSVPAVYVKSINSTAQQAYINFGAVQIDAPQSRLCSLDFKKVRAVVVFSDEITAKNFKSIPDGFSKDSKGNLYYKDISGIDVAQLNKLGWNKKFNFGFYWLPDIDDDATTLPIHVECFWSDVSNPAYDELLHYSPNWVTWANRDRGLVLVSDRIEV